MSRETFLNEIYSICIFKDFNKISIPELCNLSLAQKRDLKPTAHPDSFILHNASLTFLSWNSSVFFSTFFLESCSIDFMVSKKISHIPAKSEKDSEENKFVEKE